MVWCANHKKIGKFLKVSFVFVLFFGQSCLPMSWPLNTELIGPSHHGSETPFSNIPLSVLSEYFKGTFLETKKWSTRFGHLIAFVFVGCRLFAMTLNGCFFNRHSLTLLYHFMGVSQLWLNCSLRWLQTLRWLLMGVYFNGKPLLL